MDVTAALFRHIYSNIPKPILQEAFLPKNNKMPAALDFYIRDKVILGRILPDCNIFGGKSVKIVLKPEYIEYTDSTEVVLASQTVLSGVYRIPPTDREYRNISHVIDLNYSYVLQDIRAMTTGGRTAGSIANDLIQSYSYENTYTPPRPILLSGDLIKLIPLQLVEVNWTANCLLEYDEYFSNLNRSAMMPLMELALVATQAYIYNELVIQLDRAYIVGGQELVTIKEQVDKYADANERYQEKLMNFRGGQALDPETFGEMIKMMF